MATRQTVLTRIRQMSDTLEGTTDYPDELLKDLGSMVHVDEWKKILGESPYYQVGRRTVTLDSDLRFLWASLSTGTGNAQQSVFRVLEIVDASGAELTFAQPDRVRLAGTATDTTGRHRLWTKVGTQVQTFGTHAGATLTALVNYTPTALGNLASDADQVDFPEPYAPVLFYETAALALAKGGREMSEATELLRMADMIRQKMLADLRREAATPYIMGADDAPWEWGG